NRSTWLGRYPGAPRSKFRVSTSAGVSGRPVEGACAASGAGGGGGGGGGGARRGGGGGAGGRGKEAFVRAGRGPLGGRRGRRGWWSRRRRHGRRREVAFVRLSGGPPWG